MSLPPFKGLDRKENDARLVTLEAAVLRFRGMFERLGLLESQSGVIVDHYDKFVENLDTIRKTRGDRDANDVVAVFELMNKLGSLYSSVPHPREKNIFLSLMDQNFGKHWKKMLFPMSLSPRILDMTVEECLLWSRVNALWTNVVERDAKSVKHQATTIGEVKDAATERSVAKMTEALADGAGYLLKVFTMVWKGGGDQLMITKEPSLLQGLYIVVRAVRDVLEMDDRSRDQLEGLISTKLLDDLHQKASDEEDKVMKIENIRIVSSAVSALIDVMTQSARNLRVLKKPGLQQFMTTAFRSIYESIV